MEVEDEDDGGSGGSGGGKMSYVSEQASRGGGCGGVVAIRRNDVGPPVPVPGPKQQADERNGN
ncbi:hypothetical protein AOL_s00110g85 [Orbilia oligospora ATCC 24927]|uniref:Uncharacterized protein n=2 Tax=Orbilia oligospora TaxID=2813651 RepID=G1XKR5_ARTOA|nr:hypothetical protein AOL_s00110g85 [Orbilia oligospora ATCC 24927]EGX46261.1 hypothetical protein AOL_s00110g85 [Orbilia oligospora ATCC 24927]KAF3281188.1 hypothetical protein TWF970_002354 [Orbilia oligospora]